jgi:hypothetical protein
MGLGFPAPWNGALIVPAPAQEQGGAENLVSALTSFEGSSWRAVASPTAPHKLQNELLMAMRERKGEPRLAKLAAN